MVLFRRVRYRLLARDVRVSLAHIGGRTYQIGPDQIRSGPHFFHDLSDLSVDLLGQIHRWFYDDLHESRSWSAGCGRQLFLLVLPGGICRITDLAKHITQRQKCRVETNYK